MSRRSSLEKKEGLFYWKSRIENVKRYKQTLELHQDLKDQLDRQFAAANSKFKIIE
jgi:hypothetical protein